MDQTPSTRPSTGGTHAAGAPASGSTGDLTERAKEQAAGLAEQAKSKAEDALAQHKEKAAGALGGVAEALHATGDELRDHDQDVFARYADAAADQIEQFTRAIRERSVGDLLDEAERFARREPGLFIGGAFLAGVFGARFLKASQPGGGRTYGAAGSSGGSRGGPRYGYGSPYAAGPRGYAGAGRGPSDGGYGGSAYGGSAYGGSSRGGGAYGGAASGATDGGMRRAPNVAHTAGGEMPDAPGSGPTTRVEPGTGAASIHD